MCRRATRLQKITHIQYSFFPLISIDCPFWMFVSTLKWSHPRSSISTHFFLNRHDFSEIIIVRVYVMISRVTYIYICIILLLAYPLNVLRSQKTAQFGLALGITGVTGGVFEGHGCWEAMQPLSCESCVFFLGTPTNRMSAGKCWEPTKNRLHQQTTHQVTPLTSCLIQDSQQKRSVVNFQSSYI